jgi:hypothetical protein
MLFVFEHSKFAVYVMLIGVLLVESLLLIQQQQPDVGVHLTVISF